MLKMLCSRESIITYTIAVFLVLTACKSTVNEKPNVASTAPETSQRSQPLKSPPVSSQSTLISAAWEGNAKQVEVLLNSGADPNGCDDKLGCPLIAAAYSGSIDAVTLLFNRGARIDATDKKGMTALMNASLNGKAEVVRLLLSKGADVNVATYPEVDGRQTKATALRLAKGRRYTEIVSLLVKAGARE
jgi:ankyrin repeat protein